MPSSPPSSPLPPHRTNANANANATAPAPAAARQNGVFKNGVWYCNCPKRRAASVRTVNSARDSYGKTFYCCPVERNQGNKCDFYLLTDEAKERARAAFLSNYRGEVQSPPRLKQTTLHESITLAAGRRRAGNGAASTSTALPRSPQSPQSPVSPPPPAPPPSLADGSGSPTYARTSTLGRSVGPGLSTVGSDDGSSGEEKNTIVSLRPRGADTTTTNTNSNHPNSASSVRAMPGTPRGQSRPKRDRQPSSEHEEDLLGDLSEGAEEELILKTDQSVRHYNALGKRPARHANDATTTPSVSRTTANVANAAASGLPTPSRTRHGTRPGGRGLMCRDLFATGGGSGGSSSSALSPSKRRRFNDGDLKYKGNGAEMLASFSSTSSSSSSVTAKASTTATRGTETPQQQEATRLFGTDRTIDASGAPTSATVSFASSTSAAAIVEASPRAQVSTTNSVTAAASSSTCPPPSSSSSSSSSGGSSSGGKDVTAEIMDMLKDEKISDATRGRLRKTLDRHAGLAKTLEARIAHLHSKIANLEKSRREMRTALMDIYQST